VELLVFSQGDDQQGELFAPQPTLNYPDAFRFLLYPEKLRELQNQQAALSNTAPIELDEFGRVLITLPAKDIANEQATETTWPMEPTEPQREQLIITASADQETANIDPEITNADTETSEEELPPPRPTPFTALPEDIRELSTAARTLSRSGRSRVLFHQSWNQPVAEQGQALPIVLDDSGNNNHWSELQGSVLLYISRYLHIETNLWRNTDGRYLHRQWRMAPAPLGPPAVIIERAALLEIPEGLDVADGAPVLTENVAFLSGEARITDLPNEALNTDLSDDALIKDLADEALNTELSLEPVYPYRHAVLMQQQKRMRSNEVHYIDHPLLGLVIKITPLTEEDLLIQAELENQLWPHVKQALEQTQEQTPDQTLNETLN
jgi:hypothetical protein